MPAAHEDLQIRDQLRTIAKSSSQPSHLVPTQIKTGLYGKEFGTGNVDQVRLKYNGAKSHRHISPLKVRSDKRGDALQHSATKMKRPVLQSKANFRGRRQRNLKIGKVAELIIQACAMENNRSTTEDLFNVDKLKAGQVIRAKAVTRVRCDCGSVAKVADMVR